MDYIPFFVWLCIAIIQIVLFSIFIFKKEKTDKAIDMYPIILYNNMVYWKDGRTIKRTKYSGNKFNISKYEIIDPLNCDINPKNMIEILEKLEA
jgi:hypothetical protein